MSIFLLRLHLLFSDFFLFLSPDLDEERGQEDVWSEHITDVPHLLGLQPESYYEGVEHDIKMSDDMI